MNGLIVDNFAGGGGASTGIEMALGRAVDIAVNHNAAALAMHLANHPTTRHLREDVWDVDPVVACGGRPVDLAWFSPDCTFFSKARGAKPFRDRRKATRRRALAHVVIRWAAAVRPRIICMENVEEFEAWGPLKADGLPCRDRAGLSFRRWRRQLENHGYAVEWRQLRACDYGAPTSRKRLFVVARNDGLPVVWPTPTHGPGRAHPYRTAAECIDWTIPCPSIFTRNRPLAENTLRRIARGLQRYVIEAPEPFIVPLRGTGPGRTSTHPIDEPLSTITASGTHHGLVTCHIQRDFGQSLGSAVDAPLLTTTAGGGGKQALVAAFLAKHYTGVVGHEVTRPIGAVTTVDHHSIVTAQLELPTTERRADNRDAVRAFLLKFYGNEKEGHSLQLPLGTVTTRDRFGLVLVRGVPHEIIDIGMRMLQPRELYRAQGFPDSYVIDLECDGKKLTKTEQVRLVGNSVCPPIAAALVRAQMTSQRMREVA